MIIVLMLTLTFMLMLTLILAQAHVVIEFWKITPCSMAMMLIMGVC